MNRTQLDEYLQRIGYRGRVHPDIQTLAALMQSHVRSVPFENIDVLLGRGISLNPPIVFEKLVSMRRGGYCFEHNSLFAQVLRTFGFAVRPLAARSRIGRLPEEIPPRTHLCLEVTLKNEKWLVDVGIGSYSMLSPLRFESEVAQSTVDGVRRLVSQDGRWLHQAQQEDRWVEVCELTGESMPHIDQEVANWFTSNHPESSFRKELMVAIAHPQGRTTLRGRLLTVRAGRQKIELSLSDHSSLAQCLKDHFGLALDPKNVEFIFGPNSVGVA